MSRDERDDVPEAMSSCSMSTARIPRDTASRSAPLPTMPPPTITTSQVPSAMASRSAAATGDRVGRRHVRGSSPGSSTGRREIRQSSQPVPTMSTRIASGVWKTTSWTSVGSRLVTTASPSTTATTTSATISDLAPARLAPGRGSAQPRSASGGMPIGATRTLPACATPRRVASPVFGRWNVT